MNGLSAVQRKALGRIIDLCGDTTLARLEVAACALSGAGGDALAVMLRAEGLDRARRRTAFAPLLPLFRPRADGVQGLIFPAAVLTAVWREAAARQADMLARLDEEGPVTDVIADRFCLAAASAIRDQGETLWPGADGDQRAELASCFDLAHLARRGLRRLPIWIDRPDEEQIAQLRLLMRDAGAVAPDGARRLTEILFAHMTEAAACLRIVVQASAATGRDGFLSDSEMGVFVDRLLDAIAVRADRIAAFGPEATPAEIEAVRTNLVWCASVLSELDMTVPMPPHGVWEERTRILRGRIVSRLQALMRAVEPAVEEVLPMARVQISGRMVRQVPRLDAPTEGEAVDRARTLLDFVAAVRGPAGVFGCEAQRTKLVADLDERLTRYADEALELINAGDAPDEAHAARLVEWVAEGLERIERIEAARTVRRRVAVAGTARGAGAADRSAA